MTKKREKHIHSLSCHGDIILSAIARRIHRCLFFAIQNANDDAVWMQSYDKFVMQPNLL